MERIIIKILILLMLLMPALMSGCGLRYPEKLPGNNAAQTATLQPASSGIESSTKKISLVKKKNKAKYLMSNGIEIQIQFRPIKDAGPDASFQFLQISGLADKGLQNEINTSILMDMEREVDSYLSESKADFKPHFLSCRPVLNANNLLSLGIFGDDDTPISGLLYRLTDGKRLFLKDIFTEGTDYVSLVNMKMPEAILESDKNQEEKLMVPFTSVKPDQDFVLYDSKLFIIFRKGEGGFAERAAVSVPLAEIDDYVDVTDRSSGNERKNQLISDHIVPVNNIFTADKGEVIKRDNYNILINYPKFSGSEDAAFEGTINSTIRKSVDEVINYPNLDGLVKEKIQNTKANLVVSLNVRFNHYGLLTVSRYVNETHGFKPFEEFNTVYSFDLIKKKFFNPKDILEKFISENKELEDKLAGLVKKQFQYPGNLWPDAFIGRLNYPFIMKNSEIYFLKNVSAYQIQDNTTLIVFYFKDYKTNNLSNNIVCSISLKDLLKAPQEDFFGW